jgi:hypothetical protein
MKRATSQTRTNMTNKALLTLIRKEEMKRTV